MALKKCPKCAEKIQREAVVCRFCGADQPELPKASGNKAGLIALIGGVVLLVALCSSPNDTTSPEAGNLAFADNSMMDLSPGAASETAAPVDTPPPSPWSYNTSKDEVRGSDISTAYATSTNQVNFDFPYQGGSTLSVVARKHPAYGTDVYFSIDKGQMLCRSYRGDCYATVRFDEKPPTRVSLTEPSDNSSDTVFVEGAQGFIKKMQAAKKMVVELEFYQAGRPQFTFDVRGLEWPRKASQTTMATPGAKCDPKLAESVGLTC